MVPSLLSKVTETGVYISLLPRTCLKLLVKGEVLLSQHRGRVRTDSNMLPVLF